MPAEKNSRRTRRQRNRQKRLHNQFYRATPFLKEKRKLSMRPCR